jgi:hypothetical protein
MIPNKKIIYLVSLFSIVSITWGCMDDIEVDLWGECYNIQTTTFLNLSQSGLTGEIPSNIGALINLTYLNLYANELSGVIPPEIGNLEDLTYLDLQMNELSGQIPLEIEDMVNLNILHLNDNYLSGEIPENICDLTIDWPGIWSEYYQIPYFDVHNNNLCPHYPECLTEENIGEQDTSNCENQILNNPGEECLLENGEIGFFDCELCCWDNFIYSWLGDGYCDQYGGCAWEGPQFNCAELGYDCGDCQDSDTLSEYCLEDCNYIGDLNNDLHINVFDVIILLDCILDDQLICNEICSDINMDQSINILDVISIVSLILDI